jgi:hypothetical protein
MGAKAPLNLQLAPLACWRALGWFGCDPHIQSPHILAAHRASFSSMAASAIASTANARGRLRELHTALPKPAAAVPATAEEPVA